MRIKRKNFVLIICLSVVSAGLTLFLILLDFNASPEQILSAVVLPVWMFGLIPAYVFTYNWLKTKSFQEGLRIGFIFGILIYFIPAIMSPYLTVLFFIKIKPDS